MKPTKFLLIALCLMFNLPGRAQTIDSYFVDMPAVLMPGLPSSLRLELTEYYKSERRDSIRNQFGYNVHLLAFDTVSGYISLQTAPNTRFEMKTLQHTDSSVVLAVIHTVCGPVCSSYIHFYDKRWRCSVLPHGGRVPLQSSSCPKHVRCAADARAAKPSAAWRP